MEDEMKQRSYVTLIDLSAGNEITISIGNSQYIQITAHPNDGISVVASRLKLRLPVHCVVCGYEIPGEIQYRRPNGPVCSLECLSADYGRRGRCLR